MPSMMMHLVGFSSFSFSFLKQTLSTTRSACEDAQLVHRRSVHGARIVHGIVCVRHHCGRVCKLTTELDCVELIQMR